MNAPDNDVPKQCPNREYFNDADNEGGGRDEHFDPPSKTWEEQYAEDVGVSAYGPI